MKGIQPAILDQAERIIFLLLYAFFSVRMTRAYLEHGQSVQLLYLFDQFIVLVFLAFRRQAGFITTRLMDWFAGFAGTCLPLMIGPVSLVAWAPLAVATIFILFGLALHLSAKLTLRRSFGAVAANRGVKASGPYRYIRHPMYMGYILSEIGLLLAGPNSRNISVILLCWLFFLWRIEAEERLLAKDADYKYFMSQTPFRLVPGVF